MPSNTRAKNKKAYIFLDESGKPEVFSRKGTNLVSAGTASKFLVIAAVKITDHLAIQKAVTVERLAIMQNKLLASIFSTSYSLNAFHAQTDYREVKERFYDWIAKTPLELKITAIVADKLKSYPALQHDSARLYATVAGELLKRMIHNAETTEIIFSRRDSSLKARERLQTVVDTLGLAYADDHHLLKAKITYHHNPHYTHGGLQIADYIAHAVFQVFERGEQKWWEMIKNRVGYVQDIFNKKSYSRSNPL